MLWLVSSILAAISIVGGIAIPFGDPQFLDRAIALELLFVALTVLTWKGFRKALYACVECFSEALPCQHCQRHEQ